MSSTINVPFPEGRVAEKPRKTNLRKQNPTEGWHRLTSRPLRHKLVNRGGSALQLSGGSWQAAPVRERMLTRRVYREFARPGTWSNLKRKWFLLKARLFG